MKSLKRKQEKKTKVPDISVLPLCQSGFWLLHLRANYVTGILK